MSVPKADSLEMRILTMVRDHYPISKDDLRRKLGISPAKLDLALKRLEHMGAIEYDILPDKVYIRLKVVPTGPRSKREKKKAERKKDGDDRDDDFSYA